MPPRIPLAMIVPLALFSCASPHPASSRAPHPADSPAMVLRSSPLELPQTQAAPPQQNAIFKVVVLSSGKPGDITVSQSSGDPKIDALCAASIKNSKFRPATAAGKPIPSTITLTFNFSPAN